MTDKGFMVGNIVVNGDDIIILDVIGKTQVRGRHIATKNEIVCEVRNVKPLAIEPEYLLRLGLLQTGKKNQFAFPVTSTLNILLIATSGTISIDCVFNNISLTIDLTSVHALQNFFSRNLGINLTL